jgi:hypothetical protein
MSKPDLDHLVMLARRDRPPSAAFEALARRLRVPFIVAPVVAILQPSSALAAAAAKLGLSRSWLVGWSAGGAAAVTGAVAAVMLGTSPSVPVDASPTTVARAAVSAPPATSVPPVAAVPPSMEPQARPLPTSPARRKQRDASGTWDEPQLIERARQALSADPKRALALTQEYQRRFPSGSLSVEREVIALEALARLGQVAEARRRALAFQAHHPSSIHLPRVRSLLARIDTP